MFINLWNSIIITKYYPKTNIYFFFIVVIYISSVSIIRPKTLQIFLQIFEKMTLFYSKLQSSQSWNCSWMHNCIFYFSFVPYLCDMLLSYCYQRYLPFCFCKLWCIIESVYRYSASKWYTVDLCLSSFPNTCAFQ